MALFSVTGTESALAFGTRAPVSVVMGVATANFGGIIRDILGGESPFILKQEIYVTARLLGSTILVALTALNLNRDLAAVLAFLSAFGLRAAAVPWNLSPPRYRRRE